MVNRFTGVYADEGVQESLAGRVAVLSLTSLSQAEICGGAMEPFTIDMEALSDRKNGREEADIRAIFERERFYAGGSKRCKQQ